MIMRLFFANSLAIYDHGIVVVVVTFHTPMSVLFPMPLVLMALLYEVIQQALVEKQNVMGQLMMMMRRRRKNPWPKHHSLVSSLSPSHHPFLCAEVR